MNFTQSQNDFIHSRKRTNCVLAVPGSGKTTSAVERIKFLMTDKLLLAERGEPSVLAITFTKEAAESIRKKVEANVGTIDEAILNAGTFHSILLKALKRIGSRIDSKRIAPAGQIEHFMERALREVYGNTWWEEKTEKEKTYEIDKVQRSRIKRFIAGFEEEATTNIGNDELSVLDAYKKLINIANLIDFDSIMELAYVFLSSHGKSAAYGFNSNEKWETLLEKFIPHKHIIVDEAQDIDEIQLRIIIELYNSGKYIDIVGDDDQSIYSFRNSLGFQGMRRIINETKMLPLIKFEENHRSFQYILESAGRIINAIDPSRRETKTLLPRRFSTEGQVFFNEYAGANQEIEMVIELINHNKKMASRTRNTMSKSQSPRYAIISRTNARLSEFETVLADKGIDYQCRPGESIWQKQPLCFLRDFFEDIDQKIPRDIDKQILIWSEVINDVEQASPDGARSISKAARDLRDSLYSSKEFLDYYENDPTSTQTEMKSGNELGSLYLWFMRSLKWKYRDNLDGLSYLRTKSILTSGFRVLAGWSEISCREQEIEVDSSVRDRNTSEWQYSKFEGKPSVRIKKIMEARDSEKAVSLDTIRLLTMHGSKGLEFDYVWLVSCDDDTIPGKIRYLPDDERIEVNDEETRLMYVGMTRARDALFISFYGKSRNSKRVNRMPSSIFNGFGSYTPSPFNLALMNMAHR